MSLEALYGIPGFDDFGDEAPKEHELEEDPAQAEPITPEEEAELEALSGLFFDMREALDGVFEGQQKAPATIADPEVLKKALERQTEFMRQFSIA